MKELISDKPVLKNISDIQRSELECCGVEFDTEGNPLWHSVPEWFDELDRRLIDHYGDEYRTLANTRRAQWNKDGIWHFEML